MFLLSGENLYYPFGRTVHCWERESRQRAQAVSAIIGLVINLLAQKQVAVLLVCGPLFLSAWFAPFGPMSARDGHVAWEPVPVPSVSSFSRAILAAEEFRIVPPGPTEIEFNVSACPTRPRFLSIEYWSSLPRTDENHTEVRIPEKHQHMFDKFAAELTRQLHGIQHP